MSARLLDTAFAPSLFCFQLAGSSVGDRSTVIKQGLRGIRRKYLQRMDPLNMRLRTKISMHLSIASKISYRLLLVRIRWIPKQV
jgi:hypothetical protein